LIVLFEIVESIAKLGWGKRGGYSNKVIQVILGGTVWQGCLMFGSTEPSSLVRELGTTVIRE
jgi:hypothetical protein